MPRPTTTLITGSSCLLAAVAASAQTATPRVTQVPTTLNDFFLPGTQPDAGNANIDAFVGADQGNCVNCHANFATEYLDAEPFSHWKGSMMAQSALDPLFLAALTVANQDAAFSGDLCLRCHSPAAWVSGRSTPTDGSALSDPADFEGVTCHVCHRMVDPVYVPGVSPIEDQPIVDALFNAGLLPTELGSGRIVYDPDAKVRRGSLTGVNHPQGADAIYSPFHSTSFFCGQCHDVSNPAFSKQPDGTYLPNSLDTPHPTGAKADMFPVERTYSEWLNSAFANGGVDLMGRFGGNYTGLIQTCQDCHMPDTTGPGCNNSGTVRDNAPEHNFNGANTWVLDAVRSLYPDNDTGLNNDIVDGANARVAAIIAAASDMELRQEDNDLIVKITNYSGHKLPTGYPEGRRMWINVKFFDIADQLLLEHGHYDDINAELAANDTKVYEAKLGVSSEVEALTGVPAGESFHFALNNVWIKDNRIPPLGFTNANFQAAQAAPVAYTYADGQNWDETAYPIPANTDHAEVTVYFQTSSAEYIEFLDTENVTDTRGDTLVTVFDTHGKSAPAVMDFNTIALAPVANCPADLNGDDAIDTADLGILLGQFGTAGPSADLNNDGVVDTADLGILLGQFGTTCP
ncbi:MAG: hypothetical protein H6813_04210 [Phycisphaeraceae bacterium]|nr:hypothetical protein [Phycisphaeraceae bacterium]MCB9847151.1 hypothetical protein [Phycisphaeraceae bacterium]